MNRSRSLAEEVVSKVLHDLQRYAPGVEPARPTLGPDPASRRRRLLRAAHRGRNLVERAADRAGFVRRHVDPDAATDALLRVLELGDGLERTARLLGDDASRRALVDVLALRVVGPYHAPLEITPDRFRALQAHADATLVVQSGTWEVPDPFFSPLSLYRVPAPNGETITLHAHSVDIVSVYLRHQYAYRRVSPAVTAREGDVAFDVGGCWGDTALYLASLVGPSGRVLSFEIDPVNIGVMEANLALNPELAKRIEIVDRALWDETGVELPFASGGRMTTLGAADTPTSLHARTVTIDDFVQEAQLQRLDFVKMDVEGAELRVLAGGRATLERHHPRFALAAYHQDDDLVAIPEALSALSDAYRFFLQTFSPLEDETVLFADPGG